MELIAHLYDLACESSEGLQELVSLMLAFKKFAFEKTSRPPLDMVPYQRLIWTLDTEGINLSLVSDIAFFSNYLFFYDWLDVDKINASLSGMVQDAAAVYHQRVWRSSIYQDNLYQLTPSEKEVVSFIDIWLVC